MRKATNLIMIGILMVLAVGILKRCDAQQDRREKAYLACAEEKRNQLGYEVDISKHCAYVWSLK